MYPLPPQPPQYVYPVHARQYAQPLQPRGSIDAAGAYVRSRSSRRVLVLGILTLGLYGAFWHAGANADLGRYGRRRGRMPFAYIQVSHAWSCVAYLFGWLATLAVWALALTFLFDGKPEGIADWMSIASSAVMAAPLWATARATMQRIRTARMLAGICAPITSPGIVGVSAALLPPLYAWQAQHALAPVWELYRKPANAPHEVLRPADEHPLGLPQGKAA